MVCVGNDERDTNTTLRKENAAASANSEIVEATIGDEALKRLEITGPVALIKIDVEGHEPEVIEGLQNTIVMNMPLILWEAFTEETVARSKAPLEKMGYRYFYHLTTRRYDSRWINKMSKCKRSNSKSKKMANNVWKNLAI